MSSISTSPVPASVIVVQANNANVADGAVIPVSVLFDAGARWDSAQHRLTAVAAREVWHVRNADGTASDSGSGVAAFAAKNGLKPVGFAIIDAVPYDFDTCVRKFGVTHVLSAGDYIDLRTSGSGVVGTWRVVFERLA